MMVRKMMLAGLIGATLIGGVAPAYAQQGGAGWGNRGERAERGGDRSGGDRGAGMSRGNAMNQPRADRGEGQRWSGGSNPAPNRAVENQAGGERQEWRQDRAGDRQAWRDERRDDRQQWQGERREDRREWRDDRRDDRREWRDDRRDDRRWTDNRGWYGNQGWNGNGWNNGRRYDERTRWNDQRRWDNGWRRDSRYDWYGYRNRYGDRYRVGRYYAPRGWDYGYRRFSVGIFLNSLLYSNSYWMSDPYAYRLPPAYGTLRWVRYYDDALLVDIRDGYVVDVIHDFFW